MLTALPGTGRPVTGPSPAVRPSTHHATGQPSAPPAGWQPAGPLPPAGAGPGAAPYFVTIPVAQSTQSPRPAVVTDALTGTAVATVRPPSGGQGFTGASAAGDDRTFVLEAASANGRASGFYELQLGRDGQPLPLVRLRVPLTHLSPQDGGIFALSPDGRELGLVTDQSHAIEVVSLATGGVRRYGPAAQVSVQSLAWAGEHELAFLTRSGLHLLDTAAPGRNLAAARLVVPASVTFHGYRHPQLPLISADGSAVFMTMSKRGSRQPAMAEVVEFSAQTGRAHRAVSPPTATGAMGGSFCGALWADPSGRQVVTDCGEQGVFSNGTFIQRDFHAPYQAQSLLPGDLIAW